MVETRRLNEPHFITVEYLHDNHKNMGDGLVDASCNHARGFFFTDPVSGGLSCSRRTRLQVTCLSPYPNNKLVGLVQWTG